MTQATAARERARITTFLSQNRDPKDDTPRYRAGPQWSLPKRQVQCLYVCLGSYEDMKEMRPEMVPWPPETPGSPVVPPDEHVIYSWCRAIDAGEEEIDQKLLKLMEDRLMRKFKAEVRKGIVSSSKALQHLAQKVRDGTLDPRAQSQILSLGQAVNYGVGNYAQLHKATEGSPQQNININGGRLTINAGTPPPNRIKAAKPAKRLAAPIEAEFTEVAVGHSDSS